MQLVPWAEELARDLLASALPQRWAHVQQVAGRAGRFASLLGEDGEFLHAAAWLHDIGYAPGVAVTRFHPLDGARYLTELGAPDRVISLIAHHSASAAEAEFLGLGAEVRAYDDEQSLVRDLLWYADMTTGPAGQQMSFVRRMTELRERYPAEHYVIRALDAGMVARRSAVDRAQEWIDRAGVLAHV
ncbi:HD domain-containing protein [Pseudonocardia dioxanivorans]|uniref:HD domain-containing protein n=1 Tax=Pseudonocardia dioxanivorans TaxID=240495 RepID=UPI000CD172F9|nr:HD domain-containing protein [Pseudonocardia dioxanivorans]